MEIKGKVISEAGLPLENAMVMIVDGPYNLNDMAAITGENGEFNLEVAGKGDFQVCIQVGIHTQKLFMRPSSQIQNVVIED